MLIQEYENSVRLILSRTLENAPSTLELVLRACRGVFPSQIIELAHRHNLCLPDPQARDLVQLPSSSGIDELPGNPALCSWYFTDETAQRLTTLVDYRDRAIVFLGCPKLFAYFDSHLVGNSRTLFDVDRFIVDFLRSSRSDMQNSIIEQDLNYPIDKQWESRFDIAFFDPPWYTSDYVTWLSRAVSIVVPNGLIAFSLFPELTRPSGDSDRQEILKIARLIDPDALLIHDALQYSVPSFERVQLARSGIQSLRSWKSSDLVIMHRRIVPPEPPLAQSRQDNWTEVIVGSTRIFISNVDRQTSHLFAAPPGGSYLVSPSRRDSIRKLINVLTSDGRGFISNDPSKLAGILREISISNIDDVLSSHSEIDILSRQTLNELLA